MGKKRTVQSNSEDMSDDPLRGGLHELLNSGNTITEIARGAGVATRTLYAVKGGDFAKEIRKIRDQTNPDNRKLRGIASTLARLALHLRLSPDQLVRDYGLPSNDIVWTAVNHARREVGKPPGIDDTTTEAIEAREPRDSSGRYQGRALIGLMKWEPFYWEPCEDSFADHFMRSLIGSLDPFVEYHPVVVETLPECFTSLLARPVRCDAIFGVYDTTYRRRRGLDFISAPGFKIPLGAIARHDSGLTWRQLIESKPDGDIFPVVLEEEVGHLFFQGTCGFKQGAETMKVLSDSVSVCATRFYNEFQQHPTKKVVFVADSHSCKDILRQLDNIPELSSETEKFVMLETDSEQDRPPRYDVGIVVRADALRWGSLIRTAMVNQMFGDAALRTARLYLSVFARSEVAWDWHSFQDNNLDIIRFKGLVQSVAEELVRDQKVIEDLLPKNWESSLPRDVSSPKE